MKRKIGNIEYEPLDLFDENGHLKMVKNPQFDYDEWSKQIPPFEEQMKKLDKVYKNNK